MFNLLSVEGILSDSIQRMGKLKSRWTSHAPTAYSIRCITSWCQDENHEDCLCPDKNFHSKHLRNLFLIEVFYYLNHLHTTWKTCTQYWTPTLNQETLYPALLPHGALHNSPVFRVAMARGCLFLKLGTGPRRTHGAACFLRITGGLLQGKHIIRMANLIHRENII